MRAVKKRMSQRRMRAMMSKVEAHRWWLTKEGCKLQLLY